MSRRLISSGSPYERTVGYSRAVAIGDRIFVAGTAPVRAGGRRAPPGALRPGQALSRDHRSGPSARPAPARRRGAHAYLPRQGGDSRRSGEPMARRSRRSARLARRWSSRSSSTRAGSSRSRPRPFSPARRRQVEPNGPRRTGPYNGRMDGLGPESSVHHHRFGSGPPYTLGVEEEYMLLDPPTFDLVQRAEPPARSRGRARTCAEHLSPELFQSLLEVQTPVCADAADGRAELRRLRARVASSAGSLDLRVGSAGTHPFSLFERQRITRRDRYNGARRAAPVHRPPGADLRPARPRRRSMTPTRRSA